MKPFPSFALGAFLVGACWAGTIAFHKSASEPVQFADDLATPAALPHVQCDLDRGGAAYITPEQLSRLRQSFDRRPENATASELSLSERAIVASVLTLGPAHCPFSARVLRSLEIVRELDLQSDCMTASACRYSGFDDFAIVDDLKTGARDDPNAAKSWTEMRNEWKAFLKQDIRSAADCFQL